MAATLPISPTLRPALAPHAAAPPAARPHVAAAPLAFMAAPALGPACAFALGIALAMQLWITPSWLLLGCLLLAIPVLLAMHHAPRMLVPALASLFLVLGALAAELAPPVDPQQQLALLAAGGASQTVTGAVERLESPHQTTYEAFFQHTTRQEQQQRVDLHLDTYLDAGGRPAPLAGGLRLTLYSTGVAALPSVACGTRLTVTLPLRAESHYNDPGVWDAAEYMHAQGIGALGSVEAGKAHVLGPGPATLPCRLHSWQAQASERVLALAHIPAAARLPVFLRISPEDASMLTAMLTGDRTYLQRNTRIGFERTGSFHLLVVSGMHLAIFSSVVLLAAARLRLHRAVSTAATILLSFAYAVFTGFGQPVQRSFWMVTLFLVGRLLFRERVALQALGLAALLLLALEPRALGGSSLQMTLLTVVAIGGLAAPIAERTFAPYLRALHQLWLFQLDASLPPRVAQFRVMLRLLASHLQPHTGRRIARQLMPAAMRLLLGALELLLVSVAVELVMALPMAVYFHRVTVLGLPVNFLIVPFLGFLLPAAMLCFATQLIAPALVVLPATVAALLLHIVSGIVTVFSHLHIGDYRLPAPPAPRMVAWVLVVAFAVSLVRQRPAWAFAGAAALLLVAAGIAVAPQPVQHPSGALQVSAIDVGQGDAILIITPDGKTLLLDAGGLVGAAPGSTFDIGEEVVSPALWARGIQRLDAVAISHAHEDHIGGMAAVLANFRPRVLLVGNNPLSRHYAALLAQAAQAGIPVASHRQGDSWLLGASTRVEALWPSPAYVPRAEPENNDSLVLRLVYGHTSALLEGDAQALAEAGMLRAGLAHSDLLKVGHHGSLSSTTPAFLQALAPSFAVISCGRRNFYGHPRPATLDKLQTARVATYRTDLLGESDFLLDGTRVRAEPGAIARR